MVSRVNILRAQTSKQHISIIFSGNAFDSLTSKPIRFRLFPSSAAHCHSSGFLQKLQCNFLYEVSYEVTAVEGCCGYGIFKQCNCCYSCTVTVLVYVMWETNTFVEGMICQLLIPEVQIHVSSWGLIILTYIWGFSQSPSPKYNQVHQSLIILQFYTTEYDFLTMPLSKNLILPVIVLLPASWEPLGLSGRSLTQTVSK